MDNTISINKNNVFCNPPTPLLYEHAMKYEEDSHITSTGALATISYKKTGRSPSDKRIVLDSLTKDIWWGPINIPLSKNSFNTNRVRAIRYLNNCERIYVIDAFAGWDPKYRIKVRVICSRPYHALFMKNMLIVPTEDELKNFGNPEWVIYNAGEHLADEKLEGLTSDTSISFDLEQKQVIILGTQYAGEMKKGVFTIMNYLAPKQGLLSLHSSVNQHKENVDDVSIFFGLSGTGKCLGKDTPVMMYDGTIKMVQDVKVGDKIMGDDSKPRNVLSTCQGVEKLYEVIGKGVRYVVNESHILSLKAHPKHLNKYKTDGDIIDISIKDYFTKLPKSCICPNGNSLLCGYRVPTSFDNKEIDFDPYMLGYWLGDGTSAKPYITTEDKEIIQYFENNLKKYNLRLNQIKDKEKNDTITYRIVDSGNNYYKKGGNTLINTLKKHNLFNNKHIPHIYKCNSKKIRSEILAGIIDSDGSYDKKGKGYDITLKSEKLIDDIIYLSRSLGYAAYKTKCQKICTNAKNGPKVGTYYRTFIAGNNLSKLPILIPRKKAVNRKQIKNVLKYGIEINELDIGNYYGFEIDGNKRFLLGDFTVTHNTTLSADENRILVGDDEHVWTDTGVFNIEGGCYAKCIGLRKDKEPDIFKAIKWGAVQENIVFDKDHIVDYNNVTITQNTRAAYPLHHIKNAKIPAIANHPKNIIMLTCDAFGVLPPVSKLTPEQAMYHFISGYTAKVAGTEVGVTEPKATFSACYGAPFIIWHPVDYAKLLAEKVKKHNCDVWLVNTGWIGGGYGNKADRGKRISLKYTRAIIDSIHSGELKDTKTTKFPIFNLNVPIRCTSVPENIMMPSNTWKNKEKYNTSLINLAKQFVSNFENYKDHATPEIIKAGPTL